MKTNDNFQKIEIRKELHGKIKSLAALNEVQMRELASELLRKTLQNKEEVTAIIKRLKYVSK